MMKINIKDNLFPSSFYIAFFLISVLIVFNENICKLIIRTFSKKLADLPFELVVSTFDRALYFLLFGYFILSFVYIIYIENRDKNNFFNRIFPGFFCLIFPFFFQLIILRYQYLFRWDDAGHYVSIGINLFSGYGLSSGISGALGGIYFPYLPFSVFQHCHYLSSIFFGLFWEMFHSLKGIMLSVVLLESINCFLLYKISKKLFKSDFYSTVTSFLYFSIVLYILPLRESLQPIYDQPFSTLVFLLVYLLNKEFVTSKKAFLLGLLLGVGVLIKITSLFVLFVLVLSFLLYFPKNLKLRMKTAFLATVGFLLFFIPYQIYCLHTQGEVFPSKWTSSFYSLNYILKNDKAGDILFYNKKKNFIKAKDIKVISPNTNEELPIVISPKGDKVVGRRPKFHWTEVKGASSYEIEITTDGGATKIEDNYSNKTILALNHDLPHTRLRWRVRARNDMATGKWSSWAYFTPKDTLGQAYVISPKGDALVRRRPKFHWTEVKGASSYEIEITTDGGATKTEEFYTKKTNLKPGKALSATRLRWRVRARKDMATGEWSSWAYFTPESQKTVNLYYSRAFPYLVIMVISIFLFALYSIFNKKILKNHILIFSIIFILIYSLSILWARSFNLAKIRHFYSPITLSILIILFVLINLFRNKTKNSPTINLNRINIKKSHVLYFIILIFSIIFLWRNVNSNCRFISDKWIYKNQIFGGYEKINISNLIEWIKKNTNKNDLIAFQYDNVGEIHILSGRPCVILPPHSSYEFLIKFLKYYRPQYIIIHNKYINPTLLKFNETIEKACMELNYAPLDIIDRHKIWNLK